MSQMQEFAENKEDRCPVVLVLDTSYSMLDDGKINALNDGVQQFRDEVLKDPIAALRIEVAVVSFGGTVQVENDFTTALDFQPRKLDANGNTPLGDAMRKALDVIEDRKAVYRSQGVQYFRPWIWLMTDGQPTDDWQELGPSRQAGSKGPEGDGIHGRYWRRCGPESARSILGRAQTVEAQRARVPRDVQVALGVACARVETKGRGGPASRPATDRRLGLGDHIGRR